MLSRGCQTATGIWLLVATIFTKVSCSGTSETHLVTVGCSRRRPQFAATMSTKPNPNTNPKPNPSHNANPNPNVHLLYLWCDCGVHG